MDLLTEDEAAALLGVALLTLKRARRRGDIEYTLLGQRLIRYTQAQLDDYVQACKRRASKPLAPDTRTSATAHVRKNGQRSRVAALAQAQAILRRAAR